MKTSSDVNAIVSEYNSCAEGFGLKSRLIYDSMSYNLFLCSQEGLDCNCYFSKLQSGNPDNIYQTVRSMKMQMCFEYGGV